MKKFLFKVLILGMILGSLLMCLNLAYINTAYYKNLNDMRKFSEIPQHIDVVNFGASHSACAFDWTGYTQFEGVNMALGSQTIVYDEALFDFYFDCLDENSTVILDVMFKSLYEVEQDKPPYGTNITRYYQVLDKEHIKQWNLEDALKYKYIPILGNRLNAIPHIWSEWTGSTVSNSEEERILAGEPTRVLEGWEEEEMLATGEERARKFMIASGNQEHGEQYEALIRIIEKCQENNIQVILVTTPTLPCFYENFDEIFMDKFYKDIDDICEKYGLVYIDYTGDPRLLEDYRWYGDTDHMNIYGNKVFMNFFLEDTKDILRRNE